MGEKSLSAEINLQFFYYMFLLHIFMFHITYLHFINILREIIEPEFNLKFMKSVSPLYFEAGN